MEKRSRDTLAERTDKMKAAQEHMQELERQLQPISELFTKRQSELKAARLIIDGVTIHTDPAVLAQAKALAVALERIIALIQEEFDRRNALLLTAREEFYTIKRTLSG